MARGEDKFARLEVEFMRRFEFLELPVGARFLYLALWCYALGQHRQIIQRPTNVSLTSLAGLPHHPITSYLEKLHVSGLIKLDHRTIELVGLIEKHPRFHISCEPDGDHTVVRTGDDSNPNRGGEENRKEENRKEPPTPASGGCGTPENLDQERLDPPPPPDKIPFKDIVSAYHEICTTFPRVRELSEKRKTPIRAAWKRHPDIVYWRDVFVTAAKSVGMQGKPWADFDFMFRRDIQILEGKYLYAFDQKPITKRDELTKAAVACFRPVFKMLWGKPEMVIDPKILEAAGVSQTLSPVLAEFEWGRCAARLSGGKADFLERDFRAALTSWLDARGI